MVRFVPFLVAATTCALPRGAHAFVTPTPSSSSSRAVSSAIGAPPAGGGGGVVVASPASSRPLYAMLTELELPQKMYLPEDKEGPKALGGLKIGTRRLTVVTGASSGLGLNCAAALTRTGRHFVIMACRDVEKGKRVAKEMGMPDNSYVVMKLELGSLQSVRDFVYNLKAFKSIRPVQNLICNAAVYRPTDPEPAWTDDGFEASMGINHFGHFLLVNLLVDDMAKAKDARICIVGSITGNTNTVGEFVWILDPEVIVWICSMYLFFPRMGNGENSAYPTNFHAASNVTGGGLVYPQADLGNLQGFQKGATKPIAMADGKPFFGAKAYKDSKVCNMMTVSELHRRYHESTGISFSSMYPGCIAETALFREKRPWFRKARHFLYYT
jgi:protochlorophyllide reductase